MRSRAFWEHFGCFVSFVFGIDFLIGFEPLLGWSWALLGRSWGGLGGSWGGFWRLQAVSSKQYIVRIK